MSVSSGSTPSQTDRTGTAIRGGAVRVLGYTSGIIVSLGSATILVRYLGIESFGRYVTVLSLIGLVGGVTEAGIYVYGIREFAVRTVGERGDLIANLLGMRLTLTLIGVGCAACFGIVVGYGHVLLLGLLVAGAGLLVQVTADVLSIPLQTELRLASLAAVDLTRRVLALLIIAALALLGAGLLPFIAASAIAATASVGLIAHMVRSAVTIRVGADRRAWRDLLTESLPFAVAMSIGAVYFYVTVVIMSIISSAHQTGVFGTAFRVTQVALAVPSLLLTAIFPLMLRGPDSRASDPRNRFERVFTVSVICGAWMSLAIGLGADFIIDVVAGSQGRAAISVLRIESPVLIASFVSTASALALLSLRRYRALVTTSIAVLALNMVLALVLVPSLGARGGAVADVASALFLAIAITVALARRSPLHQVSPSVAPPIALASALGAAVVLLPIASVAHVAVATFVYFGALAITGAIPTDLVMAVRRLGIGVRRRDGAPDSA